MRIAYGTSKKTGDLRTGEFLIAPADAAAFSVSGLAYATKFDLTGSVELPYNDSRQNAYFFPKRIDEIFQLLIAGGLVLEEFRLMTDHARDAAAGIAAGNDVAL